MRLYASCRVFSVWPAIKPFRGIFPNLIRAIASGCSLRCTSGSSASCSYVHPGDVDSTIHTLYRNQQGAKGCNPCKPGRPSHHPLMGFGSETNMGATGRQLRLFAAQRIYKNYRYSCYITSLDLSPHLVRDLYKKRADAENRIKEIKYDFGSGSFNMQGFFATEAALNVVMMAYNFISLFRQVILQPTVNHQPKNPALPNHQHWRVSDQKR